jgi:hypothetical protein
MWLWLGLAALGWLGVVWLGMSLYATQPPSAGFDLELLLEAGRNVAAGRSPYDPAMLAGTAPAAPSLFYSYPPPVAAATALVAALPSALVLVLWGVGAVGGLLAVGEALRSACSSATPMSTSRCSAGSCCSGRSPGRVAARSDRAWRSPWPP